MVGVLWGLPKLDIHVPLWVLIIVMAAWATYTITIYRMGSRALRRKPIVGLLNMVSSKGEVVRSLVPEGLVRIKGELWKAKSDRGRLDTGEKVIVVGQDGLNLTVRKHNPQDL